MGYSTPCFPVLLHFPELAQTQLHWVSDAIQPSRPPLSPYPPAFILSQNQSFPMSQLFPSGGQSIRASASASVLPMNIQGWFPLFSLQSKGLSKHHSSKASILQHSVFFMVQLLHLHNETTGKTIALTGRTFVDRVMSLLFNTLSGHSCSSKEQVSFKFMAAVIICSDFGAQENKVCHCFHFYPQLFAIKWWDQMSWSSFFEHWVLSQLLHSPLSHSTRGFSFLFAFYH